MNYIHEINLITACPIEGQIRRECASHPTCHRACNSTDIIICIRVCIVNGCECPAGTVIDWEKRECVYECEGIHKIIILKEENKTKM